MIFSRVYVKKGLNVSNKWQLFQKTLVGLLKSEQTLVLHLLLKVLKQFYHHYRKWSIFITEAEAYNWVNLYNLCFTNGTKNRTIIPICTFNEVWLWFRTEIRKKLNDVNSFSNSINNIKEMITYFRDKNKKSKKIQKL